MTYKQFNKDLVYFTSDHHFYHTNIIKYCNRPFNTIEEMNQTMIDNWNNTVKWNDHVFILGDFAFTPNHLWKNTLKELNGYKHLSIGNHDNRMLYLDKMDSIHQILRIEVDKQKIILTHKPLKNWNRVNIWNMCGHVHSSPYKQVILKSNQYDVGVDNNDFRPLCIDEIRQKLNEQTRENEIAELLQTNKIV